MVQKKGVAPSDEKSGAAKRRGRPPQFDAGKVIDEAMSAFFRKGFDGTTLADLEDATGVDRSTLYNSFDGKAGLYSSATGAYLDFAEQHLFEPLLVGTSDGYADLVRFLGNLRSGLIEPDAIPGCLIVNDMAAGADPVAATRYRTMLEEGLRRALRRTADTDTDRCERRAGLLSTAVLGVNLVSKVTADSEEIARLVDAMVDEVEAWRDTVDSDV